MKIFNLFNHYHLGDSVFNIHFFNQYSEYDYTFNYYVNPIYINELNKHIDNQNINLLPIESTPNYAYNMWIGQNNYYQNWIRQSNHYDIFYVDYFNLISKEFGIPSKIKNNMDMLFDNSKHTISIPGKFNYLIINSLPFSGQFNYNEQDFINLCDYFSNNKISFITTKKVREYECTLDYGMSIVDIGNLSNNCENIIGVNTSPIIRTFTKQNIETINKRFILDEVLTFSYNNRITQIKNVNEIYNLL